MIKSSARMLPWLVCSALTSLSPAHAANLIDVSLAPQAFLSGNAGMATLTGIGSSVDFRPERSQALGDGKTATRYRQYFQGVPIWSQAVVQVTSTGLRGEAPELQGQVVGQLEDDLKTVTPGLSSDQVLQQAKLQYASGRVTQNDQTQLVVRLDQDNTAHLVYLVSFLLPGDEPARPTMLVDANSGNVIKAWDGLTHFNASGPGGNPKVGKYEFGKEYGFLNVSSNCSMDNGTVRAIDLASTKNTSKSKPFKFTCPRNNQDKQINSSYGTINDAYYFGNAVVGLYRDWLGIKPLKSTLLLHVHYGKRYENAFWDGSSMNFGDGADEMYPLVSADITGHEISHGFTEQNAGLIYSEQSGGINEAFSDMAGIATEFYVKGHTSWRIGEDVMKGSKPLRYMDHPANDSRSIEMAADFSPGMDPHHSSGVYNRAYYLLANTPDWSIKQAFQVFSDANRMYWNAESNYNQAACGVITAAKNRGFKSDDVVSAFSQVGVRCKV